MAWGKQQKNKSGTANAKKAPTTAELAPKLSEVTGGAPLPGAEEGEPPVTQEEEAAEDRRIAGLAAMAALLEKHEGILITLNDQMAALEKRMADNAVKLQKLDKRVRGGAADKETGHLHGSIDD